MIQRLLISTSVFLVMAMPCETSAFLQSTLRATKKGQSTGACRHLNLVPLSRFASELTFFSAPAATRLCLDEEGKLMGDEDDATYTLCLVQDKDLPDVSKFVIGAFGADAIALSSDLGAFELALVQPPVLALNSYSVMVAYVEVLSGMIARTKDRIATPDVTPPPLGGKSRTEKIDEAQRHSLVLALARTSTDWHIDVVATVELRLQPCDAKIPFSLPWIDKFERRLAALVGFGSAAGATDLQPYLSNLCVLEKYRGRKIGKALVRCLEDIVTTSWGYNRMYLHVDVDNLPALKLYTGEGYTDVGMRWNPFWAGKAAEIGYFVKTFKKR
jgi:ribosomal protein S18 acetylase RimI-like enzyme